MGVVLAFCIAMLAAILFPVHLYCGSLSPGIQALSNAKQLTLGLMMYASDYDDKPPFTSPFEFGDDPFEPYLKNESIHCIRCNHDEQPHPKGTSDYRFQYVLQKQACGYKAVRIILGPLSKLIEPEKTIVLTGSVNDKKGKEVIVTAFADGHVKAIDRTELKATLPSFVHATIPILNLNELLYVLPEDSIPPKYWIVPYEDVELYSKWAKEKK